MKMLRTLLPTLLICLFAPAAVVFAQATPPKTAAAQSDAKRAFEKMKTLAGSWQGAVMDIPINLRFATYPVGRILHEGEQVRGPPKNETYVLFGCGVLRPIIVSGESCSREGRCSRRKGYEFSFPMSPDRPAEE